MKRACHHHTHIFASAEEAKRCLQTFGGEIWEADGTDLIRPHMTHIPPLMRRIVDHIIQLEAFAGGDFSPGGEDCLGGEQVGLGVDGGVGAHGEGFAGYGVRPGAPDVYDCPAAGVEESFLEVGGEVVGQELGGALGGLILRTEGLVGREGEGRGREGGRGRNTDMSKHRRRRNSHHLIRLTLPRQLQARLNTLPPHHMRNTKHLRRARHLHNQLPRLLIRLPTNPFRIIQNRRIHGFIGDELETVFVEREVCVGMLTDVADGHFLEISRTKAFFGGSDVDGAGGGGGGDGVGVEVVGDFGEDGWWRRSEGEGSVFFILRSLVFWD